LVGALIPSRLADLAIIGDLAGVRPELVIVGGQVVAANGRAMFANTDEIPAWTRETMRIAADFGPARVAVPARELPAGSERPREHAPRARTDGTAWVQAMEMYDGYFKRAFHAELDVVDGSVRCDTARDVLKVAIVDRHHASKTIGIGFVRGFELRKGALAATTNCENQNLVMVGVTDRDLADAARAIKEIGGGYVAVADGKVLASVPLPIAGIMSDQTWETVRKPSLTAN